MKKDQIIKITRRFLDDFLRKQEFFLAVDNHNGWDLIVLNGSCVRNDNDEISDIDIFLLTEAENQKKFGLQPVRTYEYEGIEFEISMVATEKIFRDAENKLNTAWWNGAVLLSSSDEESKKAFERASTPDEKEIREILWTNFVTYEINTLKLAQLQQRGDMVSTHSCFYESIECFILSALAKEGIFCHNKWYGKNMEKISKEMHDFVRDLYDTKPEDIGEKNALVRPYFKKILLSSGFLEQEMKNWEELHLDKIIFQKT